MPQTIPKQYTQTIKPNEHIKAKYIGCRKYNQVNWKLFTGTNLNSRHIIVILSNILCLIAWSVTRLYVLATGQ